MIPTLSSPLRTIRSSPSKDVSRVTALGALTTMTLGDGPQSKRMVPPVRSAASKAASVQLAGVPVPPRGFLG